MCFALTGMHNAQFANFDRACKGAACVLQACCLRATSVLPLHTLQYKIPHCKVFVNLKKPIDNAPSICYPIYNKRTKHNDDKTGGKDNEN